MLHEAIKVLGYHAVAAPERRPAPAKNSQQVLDTYLVQAIYSYLVRVEAFSQPRYETLRRYTVTAEMSFST